MTARRYVLAWASGASCGLLVGWVYGSHVQRLTEAHRLAGVAVRVPEPREAPRTGVETPGTRTGPQKGVLCDVPHPVAAGIYCALPRGHEGWHADYGWQPLGDLPPFWPGEPGPSDQWPIPAHEPCPVTLGPLTCPFKGPHTTHAFQSGTWAPDRKADADERIE